MKGIEDGVNSMSQKEGIKQKICKNCEYYSFDGMDYACVNDKSLYCADWVYPWDSCSNWEKKEDD